VHAALRGPATRRIDDYPAGIAVPVARTALDAVGMQAYGLSTVRDDEFGLPGSGACPISAKRALYLPKSLGRASWPRRTQSTE